MALAQHNGGQRSSHGREWPDLPADLYEKMEAINKEMAPCHAWLRTHPIPPGQKPWHEGVMEPPPVGVEKFDVVQSRPPKNLRTLPYVWRWRDFYPQIVNAAKIVPIAYPMSAESKSCSPRDPMKIRIISTTAVPMASPSGRRLRRCIMPSPAPS